MKKYIGGTGQQLSYIKLDGARNCIFIWAHGWGRSHADFLPLAESLTTLTQQNQKRVIVMVFKRVIP